MIRYWWKLPKASIEQYKIIEEKVLEEQALEEKIIKDRVMFNPILKDNKNFLESYIYFPNLVTLFNNFFNEKYLLSTLLFFLFMCLFTIG